MEAAVIESISEPLALEEVERHLLQQLLERENTSRAATLNLICRARDEQDAAYLGELLAELAQRHPGRIFLIVPPLGLARAEGEWVARVLSPKASNASRSVCNEIIQLESRNAAFAGVATVLTPLLKGDLPVFLWWRGQSPVENPDFDRLAALANRILLDSQELALKPEQFLGLAKVHRALRQRHSVTYLTWARLTPWRQLLGQAFDTREGIEQLHRLSSVTFSACCSQPALNGDALLLAGWIASRLGWKPVHAEGPSRLRMSAADGRSVVLDFESTTFDWKSVLHAVVIRSEDDHLVVSLVNNDEKISLALQQGGKLLGRSAAGYRLLSEAEVLREELDILESDHLFQESLDRGVELLQALHVKEKTS